MLALALLLPPAVGPVAPDAAPPADARWAAVLASPVVAVAGGPTGTGVVVGHRDGFAYLLTAAHVVTFDGVEVRFTTREKYPAVAWYADAPEVLARWPDPDLALVRFKVPAGRPVPVLPLAPPGERPKAFPAAAWSVGAGPAEAAAVWAERVRGRVTVRRPSGGLALFWETARPPEPGRSGGPLLDAAGRVIGVCVAGGDGVGYHAHLDEVLAALKRGGYGWLVPARP